MTPTGILLLLAFVAVWEAIVATVIGLSFWSLLGAYALFMWVTS